MSVSKMPTSIMTSVTITPHHVFYVFTDLARIPRYWCPATALLPSCQSLYWLFLLSKGNIFPFLQGSVPVLSSHGSLGSASVTVIPPLLLQAISNLLAKSHLVKTLSFWSKWPSSDAEGIFPCLILPHYYTVSSLRVAILSLFSVMDIMSDTKKKWNWFYLISACIYSLYWFYLFILSPPVE